jgi:hypothetical protein
VNYLFEPFFCDFGRQVSDIDIGRNVCVFQNTIHNGASGRVGKSGYIFADLLLLAIGPSQSVARLVFERKALLDLTGNQFLHVAFIPLPRRLQGSSSNSFNPYSKPAPKAQLLYSNELRVGRRRPSTTCPGDTVKARSDDDRGTNPKGVRRSSPGPRMENADLLMASAIAGSSR